MLCIALHFFADHGQCFPFRLLVLVFFSTQIIYRNCPDLCKTCQNGEPAKATFHHNRFSCELPESISEGVATYATVVMGNMVGHGQRLNVSWISAEENFAFLYYSPRIWSAQVTVISSILAMALGAVVFHQQFRSFWKSSQRMLQSTPATPGPRVVASNLVLLKVASCNSCHTGKRSNGLHPQSDGLQPIGNRVRVNLRAHLRVGCGLSLGSARARRGLAGWRRVAFYII